MSLEQNLKLALNSNNLSQIHFIFEKIYITYGKLVYFKIMQYIDNRNDVEELTQDVFVQFYNNLSKDIENIKYYLLSSAKNKALDFLKSQRVNIIFDENIIQEQANETEFSFAYKEILDKMRNHLNEYEINLILKHNLDNVTFKELSIKYNKSLNSVLSTYYRALKKLQKKEGINK